MVRAAGITDLVSYPVFWSRLRDAFSEDAGGSGGGARRREKLGRLMWVVNHAAGASENGVDALSESGHVYSVANTKAALLRLGGGGGGGGGGSSGSGGGGGGPSGVRVVVASCPCIDDDVMRLFYVVG